jgi:adenine-specific DNA-methyltransferase
VSEYLRRPNLQALPASQRSLMTLVLRKLLASSTFAIASARTSPSVRAHRRPRAALLEDPLGEDYEALAETGGVDEDEPPTASADDRAAIEAEIADPKSSYARHLDRAQRQRQALLSALHVAFAKAKELGAPQKAIVFTESRKTQSYLQRVLADSPWKDGLVLFNGTNTDERSKAIYAAWLEQHRGGDRVTGSRSADMRSALVEYFRDEGQIMIATEAGAEGINLQFCSLVVNYDLP